MLKLELKSFGHLVQRADSLKKILMLGKTEGKRKKGKLRMRWFQLNGHEFEQTPEVFKDGEAWCAMVHEVAKSQTCLSDWTTTIKAIIHISTQERQRSFKRYTLKKRQCEDRCRCESRRHRPSNTCSHYNQEEAENAISFPVSKESVALHLYIKHLASRTIREQISVVLSPRVCDNLL